VSERSALTVAFDVLPLAGPRTGVGVCCEQLLRALAGRDDLDVTAFAVARRAAALRALVPSGVRFCSAAIPTRIAHLAWRLARRPTIESVAGRVEVVHGTNFAVPPTRRAAAVLTVNDVTPWRFPELCAPASRSYPKLVVSAVRRGAFVHTASRHVAGELSELIGIPLESITVIPYGLPPVQAPALDRAAGGGGPDGPAGGGGPEDPPGAALSDRAAGVGPYVLAISTIEPRKDYPGLVRAFAEIAGSHPDLRLVIAGAEGRGSAALDEAVAASGVGERVVRLGYVDDALRSSLLAGARALAYPSLYEGFGFPPLEAMAAGVPVVTTAGGALPEIVGDGAIVVPVRDTAALAGALEQVLSDATLRAALVQRGRAQAARYSWDGCAAAMFDLYTRAAASRG
jgi:glycosyltransferase involved in cell wall biosynthesis